MAEKHFLEQKKFTETYLLPYLKRNIPDLANLDILEVGCAEGGFLEVLSEKGISGTGIELLEGRVRIALDKNPSLKILVADITDKDILNVTGKSFDLIVMRDTIEHMPDKLKAFRNLNLLLKKGGFLYITFPPKLSGFAGHQQNGKSLLRKMPYIHLLPDFMIRFLGNALGEEKVIIESVIENYKLGLTIRKFRHLYSGCGFKPVLGELFLFRPVFQIRLGIKPRRFPGLPVLREFFAFGCEYLLIKQNDL